MIELHPEILKKNGKCEFVVLPYEEFIALQELLADAQDLTDLREAVKEEGDAPSASLDELKSELGLH
ncbi:MAG: type II toxin-antitoxin system Phd/YefM family antitoxin [Verrucomicrobiales bacterium]